MRYIAVSRRWCDDFSLRGSDILGRSHYEIFPDLPPRWLSVHRRALGGETIKCDEDSFERSDGSVQFLRWEVQPWLTGTGALGGIIIFTEDITARKHSESRLQLAASVFTHASEGIVISDAAGIILDVNDAFTRITGYSRDEAVGQGTNLLRSGRQSKEFYANMWRDLSFPDRNKNSSTSKAPSAGTRPGATDRADASIFVRHTPISQRVRFNRIGTKRQGAIFRAMKRLTHMSGEGEGV